jgi:CBS domain-containing protein
MSLERVRSRGVDVVDVDETVQHAACRMRDREVTMLVVVDLHDRPIGILTAHDLVARAFTEGPAAGALPVRSVMTPNPRVIPEDAPIASAVSLMTYGSIRRLPVVDGNGRVIGLVSLDAVLAHLAEEFATIGKLLESQLPHRRPVLGSELTI